MIDVSEVYPTAFVVDHGRVHHYGDIIESMTQTEIARCITQDKFTPTVKQIEFYKRELVRAIVIRRQIDLAQKIQIKNRVLNETRSLSAWHGE